MKRCLFLALSIMLSISLTTFGQEQQKEQPKDNPPPKKKSLSLDMNDVKAAPTEDPPAEETKTDKDDKDKKDEKEKPEKEKKDPVLEEVEAAILAHKSFLSTSGNQTLSTFINHMNSTLKDDQKFLLREKPPKQFIEVQQRLREARSLWGEYFTAWGKEIDADVHKDYSTQQRLLDYMRSCERSITNDVLVSEEIVKQYKKKNNIK